MSSAPPKNRKNKHGTLNQFAFLASFAMFTLLFQMGSLERILTSSFLSTENTTGGATSTPTSSSYYHAGRRRQPKLGDGCYHVFLDVGSNIGIHARFLYEPHKYPDSLSSVPAFDREFGSPRDNRDYCVFSFEPNPKFEKRHSELEAAYEAMGWRYKPIMAGASDRDGNFTFFHSYFEDKEWETGFSAFASKTLYGTNATAKTVDIIRLATWIQDEIQDRLIPDTLYSDNAAQGLQYSEPKVIMKLDIEGLEFNVFPDLLTTGALCNNIHYLMGEFHHSPGNHNYYPINLTSDGRHVLHHRKEGEQLAHQLLHMVEISETCMTKISLEDDEAYLEDPHEFPTPNETTATT